MLTFDVCIFIISFYNNIMKKNYYNEKEKKNKILIFNENYTYVKS